MLYINIIIKIKDVSPFLFSFSSFKVKNFRDACLYVYIILQYLLFFIDVEETDSNADRYRESDRSSNLSDVKADIRAGSSVSNAESVTALDSEGEGSTRGVNALALAGPVPNPLSGYRYSADYTEPSFPPKNNVSCLYQSLFNDCKIFLIKTQI